MRPRATFEAVLYGVVCASCSAGSPPARAVASATGEAGTSPSSDATAAPPSDGAAVTDVAADPSEGATKPPPPMGDGDVQAIPDATTLAPLNEAGTSANPDGGPMPWLAYNYAPAGRVVAPVKVTSHGMITASDAGVLAGQPTRLNGANSGVTFDFGAEVAGLVTLKFGAASDAMQNVSLSFTESSQFIGPTSDMSIGPAGYIDGALTVPVAPSGTYVMPANKLRGGFRYASVYLNTGGWVDLTGVSLNFTAAPTMPSPSQYINYFYSNDVLLDRIWYAGAYTVQLDTIDPKQGRAFPYPTPNTSGNWDNSMTVGVGTSVLVDGAKRDRTVWPGDLGIAVPTAYVSTGDLDTVKNSLDTLFAGQDPASGEFPRSGPPLNGQNGRIGVGSDTYHLWTLLGACNYYLYSGNKSWLDQNWAAHKKGVAFSTAKIDAASGVLVVTAPKDWGRIGTPSVAANAILYRVLLLSADMAKVEGDAALASTYQAKAAAIKTGANSLFWDATAGAYRDPSATTVIPQDGNSLAVWFGLIDAATKATSITAALHKNWNAHGAHTPEIDPTRAQISPFPGSMEVAARFVAGDDQGALDLIRLEWGYMLSAAIGTGSTFWEGYQDDGTFGPFGYTASYMSAAHGWSTGPTFALTQWTLGVAPDSAAGQTYHVIPHAGDLTHVEGALTMAPGKVVTASYDHPACGDFTLRIDSSTNAGSAGVVGIPKFSQTRTVQMNGNTVWDGTKFVASASAMTADEDANYVYVRGIGPAQSVFTYFPKRCP